MANGISTGINSVAKTISSIGIGVGNTVKNISDVYVGVNGIVKPVWSGVKGNKLFGIRNSPSGANESYIYEISIGDLKVIKTKIIPSHKLRYIGGIKERLFYSEMVGTGELNQETFDIINSIKHFSPERGPIGGNDVQLCEFSGISSSPDLFVINPNTLGYIGTGFRIATFHRAYSLDGLYDNFVYNSQYDDDAYYYIKSYTGLNIAKPSVARNVHTTGQYGPVLVAGANNKMFSSYKDREVYGAEVLEVSYDTWAVLRIGPHLGFPLIDIGGTK